MNNEAFNLLSQWTEAFSRLKPGVQRVFHETFALVEEGKVTNLTYGADYSASGACLVNFVGTMLTVGGGHGIPTAPFGEVVKLFDQINHLFATQGVNTETNLVSPLAAEIFIRNMPELKDMPETLSKVDRTPVGVFIEPTDEQVAKDLAAMFEKPAPVGITVTNDDVMDVSISLSPFTEE